MKTRPILFRAPMVRAILAGQKTQTRRIVNHPLAQAAVRIHSCKGQSEFDCILSDGGGGIIKCPYGAPGDRLWVRETWAHERDGTSCPDDTGILYRATDSGWDDEDTGLRWRPSIFMPRWASRITLEITRVLVERLQEISDADARAEGIADGGCLNCGESEPCGCADPAPDARDAFAWLWQSIHGSNSWHANPFVWVIEFRREVG